MLRALTAPLVVATVLALVPVLPRAQGKPFGLPEGAGKDRVEALCTVCHRAREILNSSGYTREGWKELTSTMVDLSSVPEEQDRIMQYLATHFPPNTKRAPKLVPGSERIAFKEWQTPTLGQRSRDPIQAPDGTIWWAGQWANVIGRINPSTGEMKEYALPANAMPHTVTLDAKGNVWYTGNKNATIGYLDPGTEKITEFKMPDPNAKDPHSAVFDAKGILWFTMQLSNRVGRLDPATGEIKIVEMTAPKSRPYGIKIAPDGAPWFACNGRPCIVRIDPATMELTAVKVPGEKARVRRLAFDSDGTIWYVNSGEGRLGRYSPKTDAIKEWPSPSGPKSHPYAIVVLNGIVWYNESGQRPDTLVRFDPRTETFQSWAIPSGNVHAGIIRHMRATPDGNLIIHQSSTNRIILVTPSAASR
ncbi:MAG: cytochrome C [Gammaproteobacteria bacterium]|nr:cytochrome C [Gammaproteobacteria bacterium]MDH3412176.1 cytochrome C [Gammaproteobacteria bacterium]